jgi:omega-3 fatty acid desaturase (delta-15 desaturase)
LGGLELASRAEKPRRGWVVVRNVAAPLTFVPEPETPEVEEESVEFDPIRKPPFTLSDIRAAIPKHCWEKNTLKSLSYVARDVVLVFGLAVGVAAVNSWFVWPLYWLAQGTMFWALFVLGHDWYVFRTLEKRFGVILPMWIEYT